MSETLTRADDLNLHQPPLWADTSEGMGRQSRGGQTREWGRAAGGGENPSGEQGGHEGRCPLCGTPGSVETVIATAAPDSTLASATGSAISSASSTS